MNTEDEQKGNSTEKSKTNKWWELSAAERRTRREAGGPWENAGVELYILAVLGSWGVLGLGRGDGLLEQPQPLAYVGNKGAQTSASWLSGGPFQRQIVPQAPPSFGQPRPTSRLGRAGRPYRPCFPHSRSPLMG